MGWVGGINLSQRGLKGKSIKPGDRAGRGAYRSRLLGVYVCARDHAPSQLLGVLGIAFHQRFLGLCYLGELAFFCVDASPPPLLLLLLLLLALVLLLTRLLPQSLCCLLPCFVRNSTGVHLPKIQLSRNYAKALERVSRELEFFPKHLQHRSKQRLTKIHQYLIRMRKLKLKAKPKLVTINPKV